MTSLYKDACEIFRNEGLLPLSRKGIKFSGKIFIRDVMGPIISLFSVLVPNKGDLVLFGTQSKWGYQDNPRYVYEWILENESDIQPVWMAHGDDVYEALTDKGLPVEKIHSLRGLYCLMCASVVVYTHSLKDVAFTESAVPSQITKIYLGHGDPVKGSSHSKTKIKIKKRKFSSVDYIITRSEFMAETKIERNKIENGVSTLEKFADKFVSAGYPKCDLLLDVSENVKNNWKQFLDGDDPEHVILYAPTKHKSFVDEYDENTPSVDFFPFDDFDVDALVDILETNNALLLLRPHPSDVIRMREHSYGSFQKMEEDLNELCSLSESIQMCTQFEIEDTNHILPFADIMITDYSSIYHDYLLLDRPILFFPYDYEMFESVRGFGYDYYENLPGPAIDSFNEFIDETIRIFSGDDPHANQRNELRNKVHEYKDSNSRKRVTDLILENV